MKNILVDAVYCFIIQNDTKFEVFQDMFKLLETYPNNKIILTGANEEQQKKYGMENLPYDFFTQKHNPEKKDREYYKLLLEKYNLSKNEVIYFEHDENAVKSALSIGISTYFYDNEKKDLISLKKFLDENLN